MQTFADSRLAFAPDGSQIEEFSFGGGSGALQQLVASALEKRYHNIYSSIAHFRAAGVLHDASVLVVRRNGAVGAVFVFRLEQDRAIVMNEAIAVADEDLLAVARHIFSAYATVSVISWHAVRSDLQTLPFPFQRFNFSEDIVISLPPSETEYLSALGKATRKTLTRHRNRLLRDYPGFVHAVYAGDEIGEHHVRTVIDFNRSRMSRKHKVSGFREQEVARFLALAGSHGIVNLISIDGRICAGSICHRVGDSFFMEVSAHDPAYDDYRLGMLCCYLTICSAIARGGREMHLLWGRDGYKYLLLGQRHDLDNIVVYRSRLQMMRHAGTAAKGAVQGAVRRRKLWLRTLAERHAGLAVLLKWVAALRNLHFMSRRT